MATDGAQFREEFQRLMRALYDSLEREGELQRQLRRTKESLISVALRLQVAIKVSDEDEATIAQLQMQGTDSRTKEILANRMAQEASDMVISLNFEINLLKRKLKIAEGEKGTAAQSNDAMSHHVADAEVDAMLGISTHSKPESAITFEKWKMDQFLYSPDTPAASEQHDKQVVQMLLAAATQNFNDDYTKPTKSGIAKMRRPTSSLQGSPLKPLSSSESRGTVGADMYETMGGGFLDDPDAVPSYHAMGARGSASDDKLYFLDRVNPNPMWGQTQGNGAKKKMGLPLAESKSPPKASKRATGPNTMTV